MLRKVDNKKGLRSVSSALKLGHKLPVYFYYTTFLFSPSGYRARKNSFFPRALEFFEEKRQAKNTIYIDLIIYVKKCQEIFRGLNES